MLELLDVQRKEASASAFMFVHQEDEVNLWGIQESIDDAERVLDVAVTRASKLQTLLAMATDGVKNVIGQFLEIERRESEEEELSNCNCTTTLAPCIGIAITSRDHVSRCAHCRA